MDRAGHDDHPNEEKAQYQSLIENTIKRSRQYNIKKKRRSNTFLSPNFLPKERIEKTLQFYPAESCKLFAFLCVMLPAIFFFFICGRDIKIIKIRKSK